MKKVVSFIILLSGALLFYSCGDTGAGDSLATLITGYSEENIVGDVIIDKEAKTITVEVLPLDLSDFDPAITVSEGAVLDEPLSIQDGVPASYTVTAEDGTVSVWSVTVTVQYGMRFTYADTEYVFTGGVTDDTYNTEVGAGVPAITIDGSGQAGESIAENGAWTDDHSSFTLDSAETGTINSSFTIFDFSGDESSCNPYFTVTDYGSVGGIFRATFNNDAEMAAPESRFTIVPSPLPLTGGFAKLLVVSGPPAS
ncbi:MAG: hypothetical protein PQJ61_12330 [Spirochaetales bacterium]|uniref:DUF5018 domain-containing protein n=1 Tax=Candidatus Thalassospirochaeta sargassi TaxID=3119039 RepID=A0AAJ1IGK7_9SPIO|nr:hypothetical protein [Spirochaetales bacterium]